MSRASRRSRFAAALLSLALALSGCAEAEQPQPQARFADQGVQATGRLEGKRIAISAGNPTVVFGDCDPNIGLDVDICALARTIDGEQVNIVIENPGVLVEGQVPVRPDGCGATDPCDDVTGHAVVDVRYAGAELRAQSGTITVDTMGERRLAGEFRLELPGGQQLVGSLNVTED